MDYFQKEGINGNAVVYYPLFLVFYRSRTMFYPMFFARNLVSSAGGIPRLSA